MIALRRPEDYSPEQGAQFEVHFEKLRNRVAGDGALPFEAKLKSFVTDQGEGVCWSSRERSPPVLKQVAELFQDELTVREVAAALKMSKTEAGRLRLRALGEGLLVAGTAASGWGRMVMIRYRGSQPTRFRPSRAEGLSERQPGPARGCIVPVLLAMGARLGTPECLVAPGKSAGATALGHGASDTDANPKPMGAHLALGGELPPGEQF